MYPLVSATQDAESSRKLTHLLNAVTDALVWVIAKSGIPSQQQSVRLANLLMLLSHVRHTRYSHCGVTSLGRGVCGGHAQRVKSFGKSVCKFEMDNSIVTFTGRRTPEREWGCLYQHTHL